jgi:hypothetical protein
LNGTAGQARPQPIVCIACEYALTMRPEIARRNLRGDRAVKAGDRSGLWIAARAVNLPATRPCARWPVGWYQSEVEGLWRAKKMGYYDTPLQAKKNPPEIIRGVLVAVGASPASG